MRRHDQVIKDVLAQEDEQGRTPLDESLKRHTADCEVLLRGLAGAASRS